MVLLVYANVKKTYDPARSKYTKEIMEPLVKESFSYCEVLRKLGLRMTGGNNSRIKEIVRTLELDTSHFLGLRSNSGVKHRGGQQRLIWQDVLIRDRRNGRKENIIRLRRAILESGVEEKCKECGLAPFWNGKPLRLQVDHEDGNFLNNEPKNVRFLCPNCHAQTPTFGTGNFKIEYIAKIPQRQKLRSLKKVCPKCGKKKYRRATMCMICLSKTRVFTTKIAWPSKEELRFMLESKSFRQLSRELGVSDSAIRKHI